jgi:preprotein translocase subunit SecE
MTTALVIVLVIVALMAAFLYGTAAGWWRLK